eukprot:jgi/Psemu1/204148/e_gw1.342.40.1
MQSRDYFINSSSGGQTTTGGYWEPHSSSIDFCETNYLLSPHVVEPHNVLSSLWGLSLLGVIGMCRGNPTGELRFKVAYGVLGVIGMGSAALHGTLHWVFQSSDELPMIYLVIAGLYCCLENDTKRVAYPWLPHTLMWCDALRPAYDSLPSFLRGCTFHVVWHATAGLGAHTILQFFVACRMSVLGKPCVIRWIAGLVPVVAPIAHVQQQHKHKHKHKADVKRL